MLNLDIDNHKIVYVVKIFAYPICGNVGMYAAYDEIPGSPAMDFACNMPRKNKLAFGP